MNILEEANEIIHGDRNKYYGHPLDNHGFTAKLWQAYVAELNRRGKEIGEREVCWLNILQKCSRDMNLVKRDNLVDTAGYAGNMDMIEEEIIRRLNN